MDNISRGRLPLGRTEEINTKLEEARKERERGEVSLLEPLHVVLQAGRERLQRKNRR